MNWNPGTALIGIGLGHTIFGLVVSRYSIPFLEIFKAGFIGQIKPEFESGFWFQLTGYFFILTGEMIRCYIRDSRKDRLPKSAAWALIATGAFGMLACWRTTRNGFDMLVANGIWMLFYRRKSNSKQ